MEKTGFGFNRFMVVLISLIFVLGTVGSVSASEKKKVYLGHLVHITGPYGGTQVANNPGFLDAVELANTHMDLKGVEIVPVWKDGATDAAKSMTAFKQMSEGSEKVLAMVGQSTGVALALKTWNIKKQIINVEGGSDDELTKLPSWTFSPTSPYVNELGLWVDYYLKNIWPKKKLNRKPRFAWLTWEVAYGRATITPEARAYIESKGVEIVGEEFIPAVPTDVSAQLMRLKQKEVDFTFGGMYQNAFAVVLKEMDKLGMIDKIDTGLCYAIVPGVLIDMVGPLARNTYIIGNIYPVEEMAKRSPKAYAVFKKNGRDKMKFPADGWVMTAGMTLTACEAIRIAIHKVGPDKVDGEAVYNAIQTIKNYDMMGLRPPLTFTDKKRFGQDTAVVIRLNNNKQNVLGEYPCPVLTKYR
jgi:branched-chain amino acid transport system substrate-binding protein